ncbi:Crp/Fnr family transcriptional regulator [uncultured Proteiniphilum sp.]|uniref:Crp/Fnr family transcriptional regulator n=1 Tax=uncultured Proteiniphilum sp. TaxID=497637 RepID=UPI00260DC1F0|nr:Crp/Fnr family transcriptional regulator [uncultured Proteiniphilum sp.]
MTNNRLSLGNAEKAGAAGVIRLLSLIEIVQFIFSCKGDFYLPMRFAEENHVNLRQNDEMVMSDYNISSCPLFFRLSEEEIDEILERCVSEVREIDKGNYIVRQGDPVQFLYLLMNGLVRTEMVTKEGNVLEIEFIEPVRPLAPAFLVAAESRYPVDVITAEKSTFYVIPKSMWMKEMMLNETLMTNFMKVNSNMTVFLSKKVQMMSIKSLKGKLSLYILENTTLQNDSFILRRTQTQLAEYFGVQRPSLARTLGEMIREGMISLYKRELKVLNRKKLEELV